MRKIKTSAVSYLATGLASLAVFFVSSASLFWIGQPEAPKELLKK